MSSRAVGFRNFAALFRERLFVGLASYADESGTHDAAGIERGSEVAIVAGYVSWKENWDQFCIDWQGALDRYGIVEFHMQEFADEINGPSDPKWPYRDWSRDKKDRFIRELVPIARDSTIFGIGGGVDVRAYDRIMPAWLKAETQHPYHFCFQMFFDQILVLLREKLDRPLPLGEQIAFFFDQQQEFKGKAEQLFDQIKALRDREDRMGSLTYASRTKYIQLQAADLLAYRTCKVLARKIAGKKPVSEGSWDEELESRHNLVIGYFDEENLTRFVARVIRDRPAFLAALDAVFSKD